MASLIDLYKQKVPKTGAANTKGIDKTPIGLEEPFEKSKDLVAKNLDKPRKGPFGGYDTTKKYSDSIKTK
jgi:hypothetical protein